MTQLKTLALILILFSGSVPTLHAQVSSQGGEEIVAIARSDDGSALATVSSMGVVRVRDAHSNRVIKEMNNERLEGVSLIGCRRVFFLPGNRLGVLGFTDLRIFDISSGTRMNTYTSERGFDNIVSSNGRYFVFFRKGLTEIVDLFEGVSLAKRGIAAHRAMDVSTDGRFLFHYLEEQKVIECMEIAGGKISYWIPAIGVTRIILTRQNKTLLAISGGTVTVWNLADRKKPAASIKAETWNPDLPFVTGEEWLVLPGPLHKNILVYHLDKPQAPALNIQEKSISGSGSSGNTYSILLAKVSKVIEYDLIGRMAVVIGGGVSDVYRSVCLSPDERKLLLGTEDGYVKYFDVRTGTYRGDYWISSKPVTSLKFSEAGKYLEVGSDH